MSKKSTWKKYGPGSKQARRAAGLREAPDLKRERVGDRTLAAMVDWEASLGRPAPPYPANDVLERQLLRILLISATPLPKDLHPQEFVDPVNCVIYGAMRQCQRAGQRIDVPNLVHRLQDEPAMEQVGGLGYLHQLKSVEGAPDAEFPGVEAAAGIICELAHARDLLLQLDNLRRTIEAHEEMIRDPSGEGRDRGRGCGRGQAHSLAMDLTGVARDVLDRSLGWA